MLPEYISLKKCRVGSEVEVTILIVIEINLITGSRILSV